MEVWIGLVDVIEPDEKKILGGAKGAYGNVLAVASNPQEYESAVTECLQDIGLRVLEFEDVEPFGIRTARYALDRNLVDLASDVQRFGEVRFGDFYTYDSLDA
jgi:hypothetical protein